MNEFTQLRRRAQEKRDRLVNQAKAEYAETLTRIAALEQDLLGRDLSTHRKVSASIESVIPSDRPFTTVDIMTALAALDPSRDWRKRSVDGHLSRLRERGLVTRLKKSKNTQPAVYIRTGVPVDPLPFPDMTLAEVVAATLATRPMTQTEIVVSILEAGYETTMEPKALRNAVGTELRKGERFRVDGGKWMADDAIEDTILARG